jgi:capsid protein
MIKNIKQLNRYTKAELMGRVFQSRVAAVIESESGLIKTTADGFDPTQGIGSRANDYGDDKDYNTFQGGTTLVLKPGEKYNNPSSSYDNSNYTDFWDSQVKQIGMAIQIPYEVLIQHFSSSYSASRAALLEAWSTYAIHRNVIIERFITPVFREWLYYAISKGEVSAPGFNKETENYWNNHTWIGKDQRSIDPMKDSKAAAELIGLNLKSRSRVARELGGYSFEKEIETIKKEHEIIQDYNLDGPTISEGDSDGNNNGDTNNDSDSDSDDNNSNRSSDE